MIELNQVYLGDNREVMEQIDNDSIDIVFTSPPYNCKLPYENYEDNLEWNEYWIRQSQWLEQAYRVMNKKGRLFIVLPDPLIFRFKELAEDIGFKFHQILVWCKPNQVNRGISKDFTLLTELCLLFHKDSRTKMQNAGEDIRSFNWIVETATQSNFNNHQKKVFVAQLPYKVAYAWLARTPGDIVLDPFSGSGTTLLAARALNRNYIGIDIDPFAVELSRKQLQSSPMEKYLQLEIKHEAIL